MNHLQNADKLTLRPCKSQVHDARIQLNRAEKQLCAKMNQIRDLVIKDPVALSSWGLMVDDLVPEPGQNLKIKHLLRNHEYGDAILDSLQIYQRGSDGGGVAGLVVLLKKRNLIQLAKEVQAHSGAAAVVQASTRPPGPSVPPPPQGRAARRAGDPNAAYKREIAKSLIYITENTDQIPTLLSLLLGADVIDEDEMEKVKAQATKADQVSTLVLMFTRKPQADWEAFKQALMDSRNEHVAEKIEQIARE